MPTTVLMTWQERIFDEVRREECEGRAVAFVVLSPPDWEAAVKQIMGVTSVGAETKFRLATPYREVDVTSDALCPPDAVFAVPKKLLDEARQKLGVALPKVPDHLHDWTVVAVPGGSSSKIWLRCSLCGDGYDMGYGGKPIPLAALAGVADMHRQRCQAPIPVPDAPPCSCGPYPDGSPCQCSNDE